ncbi:myb family transcription factor EFM-like [Typha angustifolia]|uniref:myb family transcription factor EFM-like n=1 Tax=Typha angustifolia TaxID=59011 RepID=UPI003C2E54C1
MGLEVSEIGLDLKLCAMKSIDEDLKGEGKVAKMEEFVRRLEEERFKIDVFKRELPLCVRLLRDVIEELKEEVKQRRGERFPTSGRVIEEFIPIKRKLEEEGGVKKPENDGRDKMNWMSSVQLWTDNYDNSNNEKKTLQERDVKLDQRQEEEAQFLESKSHDVPSAFVPFRSRSTFTTSSREEEKISMDLPDLSMRYPGSKKSPLVLMENYSDISRAAKNTSEGGGHLSLQYQQQQQLARKTRRCWSPELHRRFLVALKQLGGPQVATPKQIRELMKVDGLTNDEVKSHLQKYRLHTRRTPTNDLTSANRTITMMGGLWVNQEHCTTSQQSGSQSGSPQGPLQLGDSCEEDDGKSGCYSWK